MNADEEEEVMKELAALQEELVSYMCHASLACLIKLSFQRVPTIKLPEAPSTDPIEVEIVEPVPGERFSKSILTMPLITTQQKKFSSLPHQRRKLALH